MTELTITLMGEVRESNFEEWRDGLVERIHAVDATLSEDDDFTSASDDVSRTWRVAIDLSAPRTKADQIFTRVRDRWKTDRAVVSIDLLAVD